MASLPSRRDLLAAAGLTAAGFYLGGCAAPAPSGPVTINAREVPSGGGKIVGAYVVTQPEPGVFVAFSALCPHQNLPVQAVTHEVISCGRHGSVFSFTDGSVLAGPATKPLAKVPVQRTGDTLTIG